MHLPRPEGWTESDLKPSRRALGGLFFAGYAAAGLSAEARPATTDAEGLVIEEALIEHPDGVPLPAYLARPAAEGRRPAVIVISEIFGVHAWIKDVCRRLAKAGYVAVAPAFFHRAVATMGDPAATEDRAQVMRIVATAGAEQVMGDVAAALAWLRGHAAVKRNALGITGFCWGGTVVWTAAARFPQLRAGVAWYGRVEPPASGAEPGRKYPIALAAELKAPVLGLYGALDRSIPVEGVERMRAALAAAGGKSEIVIYPDADHGFLADYRANHHPASAEDGWVRMMDWFERRLD